MSSHHFVKEGQEPALLILNGNITEITAPLLEWAPLVMVSVAAAPDLLRQGVKIDIIIHEETESLGDLQCLVKDHGPVTFLQRAGDSSAVVTALLYLKEAGHTALNVISSDPLTLFQSHEALTREIGISIFDGCWKTSTIASGRFEKWLPGETALKVQGHDQTQRFVTEGLSGTGPTFVAVSSGIVQVRSDRTFWVSEQYC
jgi:hypothetical protein